MDGSQSGTGILKFAVAPEDSYTDAQRMYKRVTEQAQWQYLIYQGVGRYAVRRLRENLEVPGSSCVVSGQVVAVLVFIQRVGQVFNYLV